MRCRKPEMSTRQIVEEAIAKAKVLRREADIARRRYLERERACPRRRR